MSDLLQEGEPHTDLLDRRWVKTVLFILIPAMVFALVSAAIRVSEYGIDHTILVYGDKTWVAGGGAAIRVTLAADDGRFLLPEKLTLFLVRGGTRHQLFNDAVSDRGSALAVDFEVPDVPPGEHTMEMHVRFDDRRRRIEMPIAVVETPPEEALDIPADASEPRGVDRVQKGAHTVRLFTEDRGAPTGIDSTAFLRVTGKDGVPAGIPLSLSVQGRAVEIESDRLGIAALRLEKVPLDVPITVEGARPFRDQGREPDAGDSFERADGGAIDTSAALYPNVVYCGISLSIHNPIVTSGSRVKVTIEQVSSGGPVYANLFHDGRFVHATSGFLSGNRAVMEIRPAKSGLYRLQVATSAIGAGDSVAVRHFYVLGADQEPVAGLRTIMHGLKGDGVDKDWADTVLGAGLEQGGYELQEVAAFVLARYYKGHRHPPQLISSRLEDDKELAAFKRKFQRMMMVSIIALGLGVSFFIGLLALAARRRQARITQMILEEDEEGAAADGDWTSQTGYRSKGRLIVQGAILFFIVLGAFVAIALLVDTLTWSA